MSFHELSLISVIFEYRPTNSLKGSLDRIIRIWDVRSGQFITRLEGHKDSVYSVTFSSDGKSLVSGSLDKTLKLWDLVPVPPSNGIKASYRNTLAGHKVSKMNTLFAYLY
jgi:glucose repression regulatory protein TUP1